MRKRDQLQALDHKLKDVEIKYDTWDNCSADTICTRTVSSNEPASGTRDENRHVDWIVADAHHLRLHPVRSKEQNGHFYTITITCTNSSANSSSKTVMVSGSQNQH
jgi:hypothetical protein